MHKILVVDDEPDILDLLKYNLEKEGYTVAVASDGLEALEVARRFIPDLILLDVMMPKMDGIETCRQIRKISTLKEVYILFLTARSEEYSEVAAFENGANDYITKPVKPRALISRISAFFRRETSPLRETTVRHKDLVVDKDSYTVYKNDQKILLPRKEFELLFFLMQHPNSVYNRDDLLRNIWGTDVYVVPRTVDVHIRKLREKIGEDYIKTIKGIGYKFETEG
jgi:two-component system, OmpR family, alkaline phosphatase synthesis response regulator PhoP